MYYDEWKTGELFNTVDGPRQGYKGKKTMIENCSHNLDILEMNEQQKRKHR